ncbi:MAG: hypothetical protein EOM12_02725 [Verrucomicrobiae bacterium]|nr:hypothetical protein [Verrucomicrobiae bacterium]
MASDRACRHGRNIGGLTYLRRFCGQYVATDEWLVTKYFGHPELSVHADSGGLHKNGLKNFDAPSIWLKYTI